MPLGCLSVLVTWLNLITISPASQLADAACAVTAKASAIVAVVNSFIWVSSQSVCIISLVVARQHP